MRPRCGPERPGFEVAVPNRPLGSRLDRGHARDGYRGIISPSRAVEVQ